MDKEYCTQAINDLTEQLNKGIANRDEFNLVTRRLIHFYIKMEDFDTAKDLMRQHFNFNRKDLLVQLAQICEKTDDTSFAEELIGEVRCYAYTWLEFAVTMQQLYTNHGETEKAEVVAQSIIETAFLSIRPATKAMYKSLEISGKISDSYTLKNLYHEIKRIHKEFNIS